MNRDNHEPAETNNRQAADWQVARARLSNAAQKLELSETASVERGRLIMEERGRALARVPASIPQAGEILEVVNFVLSEERYGIEAVYVREVFRLQDLARVPGTPDFLAGIINLRGEILAVIDLRKFFGLPTTAATDATRVIVLGREGPEFGILADTVHEAALLRADELLELPGTVSGIGHEHLRGVTRDALIVFDGGALLNEDGFFIDQADESN